MKYNYYVAIIHDDNTLEYVTEVDHSTKTFYCKKGEVAKKFGRILADELMYCMCANMCNAVVVKTPYYRVLSNE